MNSTRSWKKPTPDEVSRAILQLARQAHYRYFFDRLENPEWIEPLWKAQFFTKPPDVIRDQSQGTVQFSHWPESQYLARMAAHKPELVRDIIRKIPCNGNPLVYENLVDAAVAMPAEVAAELIEMAVEWTKPVYQWSLLPEKIGALVAHLARGGKKAEAITLARQLLTIVPDSRTLMMPEDAEMTMAPEPQARFDLVHYEGILRKHIPELVAHVEFDALEMLCGLLSDAIRFSQRQPDNLDDYSYIWRPAVEEHEQNLLPSARSLLVTAVRDASSQLVRVNQQALPKVIEVLRSQEPDWRIFTRIALYVVSVFTEAADAIALAGELLTERDLFENPHYRHEYVLALRRYSPRLQPEKRAIILDWLSNPPPAEFFKNSYKSWAQAHEKWPWEKELSDEGAAKEQRRWQFVHLNWFGDSVPDSMKGLYEELAREFPEEEHPEFSSYVRHIVGPSTPLKAADLQGMSIQEIVSYLKDWSPSPDFMGDSREGLGREITFAVTENPKRFSEKAQEFQACHPTYVRSLLHGFRDAIGKERTFEWKPVLDLCSWVLSQKDADIPKNTRYWAEEDADWGWTRNAIAYLLEVALSRDSGKIPFTLRHDVWNLLYKLSDDRDPTPERESRQIANNTPPSEIAINSTRGVTMNAVIHYALWVRRFQEKTQQEPGFDEIPEVREVLSKHLDAEVEPSLSIRSAYGRWFPWIYQMDSGWATGNADHIFPPANGSRRYWEVAWGTYLALCPAYDDVFPALRPQYELAVDRLGQPQSTPLRGTNLETNLAAHLMAMYWRGKLDIDDPLLRGFFDRASPEVRSYALETIGRWLRNLKKDNQPPSADLLTRLTKLWERRLIAAVGSSDKAQFSKEVASFAWWFYAGVFDVEWAIGQLEQALAIALLDSKSVDRFSHVVIECLAEAAKAFPESAIRCLALLEQARERTVSVFLRSEPIRAVLSSAMNKGGESERLARKLINELGKRGISEYRALLSH